MSSLIPKLLSKVIDSTSLDAAKAYADAALLVFNGECQVDVWLESRGEKFIEVIKILRAELNLGLKESKELSEAAPVCIKITSPEEANRLKKLLEDVGGKVTLR